MVTAHLHFHTLSENNWTLKKTSFCRKEMPIKGEFWDGFAKDWIKSRIENMQKCFCAKSADGFTHIISHYQQITSPSTVVITALVSKGCSTCFRNAQKQVNLKANMLRGFKMSEDDRVLLSCGNCGKEACKACKNCSSTFKRCSRCKVRIYCSTQCQQDNWPKHKMHCHPPEEQLAENFVL